MQESAITRSEFWMRAAAAISLLLSGAIGVIGFLIKTSVDNYVSESKELRIAFNVYTLTTERRTAMIEEQVKAIQTRMQILEQDERVLETQVNSKH